MSETLLDGDQLFIPGRIKWILVDGAVRDVGLRPFATGQRAEDYIEESGGILRSAGETSLTYPDGRVIQLKLDAWNYEPVSVPPGSVIMVDDAGWEDRCGSSHYP